jgi:transglutaminase-like putative cysteine protease
MTHQVPVLLQPTASNPRLHAVAQHAGPEPTGDVVRIALRFELGYEVGPSGADFVFCIHAAQTPRQIVADEVLWLSQDVDARLETDAPTQNRLLRLHANAGELRVHYHATVDMAHTVTPPERLPQVSVDRLPLHVARYILPSRYCQSDRVSELAMDLFAHLPPGYERVLAVQDWVRERVRYESNTSDSATTALDTLDSGKGVCRDFAHVMITMCRALNLPARFTTGTDYGASAALGPPDFHAYVEVFLGGRWCIFDPSGTAIPMGMVRLAVGRDAADVAVAMMFGSVQSQPPRVSATAIEDPARNLVRPVHVDGAISTDLARAAWVSVPASARRAEIN